MKNISGSPGRYLLNRPNTAMIWFRMAVPKEHRAAAGKAMIQQSLGTTDRREAAIRAGKLRSELFESWRGTLVVPSENEMEEAAVFAGYDMKLDDMDDGRRNLRGTSRAMWRAHSTYEAARLEDHAHNAATGDTEAVGPLADEVVAILGWHLPEGSEGHDKIRQLLNEASLAMMRVSTRRNAGDIDAETDSRLVQRVRQRERETAPAGQAILDLFDKYAAERLAAKKKRPDTIKQDRKVIEQFADFVGRSRNVRSITTRDVREWIDTMAMLPPSYRLRSDCQGLSVRQVAAKFQGSGEKAVSLTTLNKYLSTVSPLFTWMKKKDYRDQGNPCDGLFNEVDKGENRRPSLTSEQINTIFGSPLFTGFLRDGQENLQGNVQADDWRYWIPLICLFTGTRIGEAAQLRIDDVRCKGGLWFLQICHDEATGQATKSRKTRPVALHSTLQALGFLAFVERQRKRFERDANAQLFPELEPNDRDQISGVPSRFWRRYLGKIKVKDGGDGFGAHSFRHTLADRLREEGKLLDNEVAVALGHSLKSTTGNYGAIAQGTVEVLHDMIERVRFDGVDFSHLMPVPVS